MTQAAQLAQYGSNNVGLSFKNRIINGDMTIAQRGTSAVTTDESFPVDRFKIQVVNANLSLVQSSTAPAGFNYSTAITVTSTTSTNSNDRSNYSQRIEGFNIADLMWGTANAKTVTVSFWARSTVAGTYSGNITNSVGTRSYIFTYALTANTWTYVTSTIAGDTGGSWLATNGTGIVVNLITLNCGSNFQGVAGSWIAGDARGTSGSTYLATNNSGAVFNITGAQLEVGSVATSFDYLPYGTELQLCQRYCEIAGQGLVGIPNSSSGIYACIQFKVEKRASPSVTLTSTTPIVRQWGIGDRTASGASVAAGYVNSTGAAWRVEGFSGATVGNPGGWNTDNLFVITAEL